MIVHRYQLRYGLYAGLVWIVAEALLFWLIAGHIGFFPTLLVLTAKGIGGFMLMASQLRTVLGRVALRDLKTGLAAASDAGFLALAAFLIFLPGFLPSLAGLALFAPSVRMGLVRWLKRKKAGGVADDGILTLDPQEWQEVGAPKRKRRVRKSPAEETGTPHP